MNDIIEHTNRGNTHAPSTEGAAMPVLLFAEDLEVPSCTSNGLQKEIDEVV
jgi:hypothetical protein